MSRIYKKSSTPVSVTITPTSEPPYDVEYDEIFSIINGITTSIISFSPLVSIKLVGIDVGGTNIAMYEVLRDAAVVSKKYTSFSGSLNESFDLNGLVVNVGQTVSVDVTHTRPDNGDFNATIKYREV